MMRQEKAAVGESEAGSFSFSHGTKALAEDGYVIWRGILDPAAIDLHLRWYEAHAAEIDGRSQSDRGQEGLQRLRLARTVLQEADETHHGLCFHPDILAFAQSYFGAEPVLRLWGTHLYTAGSHIHADCLNSAATDPWEHELRLWCALEDVDPASGPIYHYPGSHRSISGDIRERMLAETPAYHDVLLQVFSPPSPAAADWYKHLTRLIQERVGELGLERLVPPMKKGDVLIFAPAIIHGSVPAERPELTRKCMIFNLFALGARFYVPGGYWGPRHDYRRPENEVHFNVARTSGGLRILDYLKTCEEISRRRIVTS